MATKIDVSIENHGSIILFHLHTDAARAWVEENVGTGPDVLMYGPALVVEPRYARDLADGMIEDGALTVI